MSIVWNNNLGEIGAKQSEYEEAAPSQYLHLSLLETGQGLLCR